MTLTDEQIALGLELAKTHPPEPPMQIPVRAEPTEDTRIATPEDPFEPLPPLLMKWHNEAHREATRPARKRKYRGMLNQ